jgi:hypothetical protein
MAERWVSEALGPSAVKLSTKQVILSIVISTFQLRDCP